MTLRSPVQAQPVPHSSPHERFQPILTLSRTGERQHRSAASSSTSGARPDNGNRCSRFAFMVAGVGVPNRLRSTLPDLLRAGRLGGNQQPAAAVRCSGGDDHHDEGQIEGLHTAHGLILRPGPAHNGIRAEETIAEIYRNARFIAGNPTLEEFGPRLARVPLAGQPGRFLSTGCLTTCWGGSWNSLPVSRPTSSWRSDRAFLYASVSRRELLVARSNSHIKLPGIDRLVASPSFSHDLFRSGGVN